MKIMLRNGVKGNVLLGGKRPNREGVFIFPDASYFGLPDFDKEEIAHLLVKGMCAIELNNGTLILSVADLINFEETGTGAGSGLPDLPEPDTTRFLRSDGTWVDVDEDVYTAAEEIQTLQAVYPGVGGLRVAKATDLNALDACIGIAVGSATAGEPIPVIGDGRYTNDALSLINGKPVFVTDTGFIGMIPGINIKQLGVASSTNTIVFFIQETIAT